MIIHLPLLFNPGATVRDMTLSRLNRPGFAGDSMYLSGWKNELYVVKAIWTVAHPIEETVQLIWLVVSCRS